MSGYRSGGGFAEGFQGGWGLADSYLNRQEDRKRQKFEDARREEETKYQRTQDGLARTDRLNAAKQSQDNWATDFAYRAGQDEIGNAQQQHENFETNATAKLEREKLQAEIDVNKAKQLRNKTMREATEWLQRGIAGGHFVQSTTGDPNDARFIPSEAGFTWLAENGMGIDPAKLKDNPMQVFKDLRNVEGMLATQGTTKEGLKSFTRLVEKVINKRGKKVTHSKVVQTKGGPMEVQGWDIIDREIINLIPGPEGKTFAFDMKVIAKDPATGQEVEYSAPATLGGDNDPNANVQQFTIAQMAGIVGMQRESLNTMMKTPSMKGIFRKAQIAMFNQNPDWAKFQQTERKNKADQAKATAEQAYKSAKLLVDKASKDNKHSLDNVKVKVAKRKYLDEALRAMGGEDHAKFTSVFYQSFNALKPILSEKYAKTIAKSIGVDPGDLKADDWAFYDLPELARSRILADFSEEYKGSWFKFDDMFLGRYLREVRDSMVAPTAGEPNPEDTKGTKKPGAKKRAQDLINQAKRRDGEIDTHLRRRQMMDARPAQYHADKGTLIGANDV